MTSLAVLRCIFVSILAAMTLNGCSNAQNGVCYILPRAFRGEFHIYFDSQNGELIRRHNNTWELRIPENGKLYVSGPSIFSTTYVSSAMTADGENIKIEGMSMQVLPNEVAIRHLGADSAGYFFGFVGTEDDYRAWLKR